MANMCIPQHEDKDNEYGRKHWSEKQKKVDKIVKKSWKDSSMMKRTTSPKYSITKKLGNTLEGAFQKLEGKGYDITDRVKNYYHHTKVNARWETIFKKTKPIFKRMNANPGTKDRFVSFYRARMINHMIENGIDYSKIPEYKEWLKVSDEYGNFEDAMSEYFQDTQT